MPQESSDRELDVVLFGATGFTTRFFTTRFVTRTREPSGRRPDASMT